MIEPISAEPHPVGDGVQKLYRFDNGYGASVIRFSVSGMSGSYGWADGLWELAVLKFDAAGKWDLTYDTPITEDVLGHLDDEAVQAILAEIRGLPRADTT